MINKSAKDVFDACLTLEPGFTQSHVEDLLGLKSGVLQRLFTKTGAFRKLPVGYTLASRIFEDWCVLAGIDFPPVARALLASAKVDATGIPTWISERVLNWDSTDLPTIVASVKQNDWRRHVERLIDGSLNQGNLDQVRLGFLYLALMADYALNDKRYTVNPESIWESRPL